MNKAYETIEQGNFTIKIYQDDIPESPREWDNLGKMVCFHSRYTLGDKHNLSADGFNGWDEMEEHIRKELNAVVCLPLFLYDHSNISMKTFPHGQYSGWDGGYVGFIYATKADILKVFSVKRISKALLTKVEKILTSEVETYSQYLQGDVWTFVIEDEEENIIDSCGGFYGMETAIEEAKSQCDYYIKEEKKNLKNTEAFVLG